jgi:hypothetical protein
VPNILKVLNPLFLDDLRAQLEAAGDNARMLLNLRKRMAKIRVFDPACGSGNFLVIAYKEMREIEAAINTRRGEAGQASEIPLTNFRGIELRDFPAEIARLALIIAEYQCDVLYRGQKLALNEFLPLDAMNWITCGNALRLDWLSICPPTGTGVKMHADDLFHTPLDQAQIDFENEGGETYICGNPPYKGTKNQSKSEKEDLLIAFIGLLGRTGSLDYVAGWFAKAAVYARHTVCSFAFVSTNSICQGGQVPVLWPAIFEMGLEICFAYQSFKWRNLASNNAGVTVIIAGLARKTNTKKRLFVIDENEENENELEIKVDSIGPYLIPNSQIIVTGLSQSLSNLQPMSLGNAPYDGGHLIIEEVEIPTLDLKSIDEERWLRPLVGSNEVINGSRRFCIWIENADLIEATSIPAINARIEDVRLMRLASSDAGTRTMADRSHQFREMKFAERNVLVVPIRSSENRKFLPVDLFQARWRVTNLAYAIYDSEIYNLSIIASRLHVIWISAVCGKLETRFSYSNQMGWHTFPVPPLTEKNKADLTRCAEDILLAREAHWPKTIADLYDPEAMPEDLSKAHARNDEVLERIYIGRRFKNDTERLEKLFDMYTKMTAGKSAAKTLRKVKN